MLEEKRTPREATSYLKTVVLTLHQTSYNLLHQDADLGIFERFTEP